MRCATNAGDLWFPATEGYRPASSQP